MKTLMMLFLLCTSARPQSIMILMGSSGGGGTVATPIDSPGAGSYGSAQTVTLSSSTSGATICYTTNGTTPAATTAGTCSTGTTYSTGISVAATTTIKAIGTKTGMANSGVLSGVYTISGSGIFHITGADTCAGSMGAVSTSAVDVSAANFIVAVLANGGAGGSAAVESSPSGITFTSMGFAGTAPGITVWYAQNPSGSSAETFHVNDAVEGMCIMAFSGMVTSAVFETGTDHYGQSASPVQASASSAPGSGNQLLISAAAMLGADTATIDAPSGFSTPLQISFLSGNYYGAAISYKIQSGSATFRPTWTAAATTSLSTAQGAFQGQ
jgi:hypothetical protein